MDGHAKMMKLIGDCRQLIETQKKDTMQVVCRYGIFKGIKVDIDDRSSLQSDKEKARLIEKQLQVQKKMKYNVIKEKAIEVENRIIQKQRMTSLDRNHNIKNENADISISTQSSYTEMSDDNSASIKSVIENNIIPFSSSDDTCDGVTSTSSLTDQSNQSKKPLRYQVDPICLMSLESVEFRDIAAEQDNIKQSKKTESCSENTEEGSCSVTVESNCTVVPKAHGSSSSTRQSIIHYDSLESSDLNTDSKCSDSKTTSAKLTVAGHKDSLDSLDSAESSSNGAKLSNDSVPQSSDAKNGDNVINNTMKSLHTLQRQQDELDNWYEKMLEQLEIEKVRMAEKYEELKLKNIREQKKLIDRSHDILDHPDPPKNNVNTEATKQTDAGDIDYYSKLRERRKSRPVKFFLTPTPNERKPTVDFLDDSSTEDMHPPFQLKETLTSTPQDLHVYNEGISMDREKVRRTLMKSPPSAQSHVEKASNKSSPKTGEQIINVFKEMSFQEKCAKIIKRNDFNAILLTEEDITRLRDILVSVIKGFLVRQLMKTSKVENIIHTIKDTEICLREMDKENGHVIDSGNVNRADIELKERLSDEIRVKRELLHDIFFKYSPREQMKLLSQARRLKQEKRMQEAYQEKSSAPVVTDKVAMTKKLSTASQRSMQRRNARSSVAHGILKANRPKTAPGALVSSPMKKYTNNTEKQKRPLRQLQTSSQTSTNSSKKLQRPKTSDSSGAKTVTQTSVKKPPTRKTPATKKENSAKSAPPTKEVKQARVMAAEFKKRSTVKS